MGADSGALGDLPAANLPLIAAVLGALFELDNTAESGSDGGTRVAESQSARAQEADEDSALSEQQPSRRDVLRKH
jgi:hypothetical protein